MKALISNKIKLLYGSKAAFCTQFGYKYKNFGSKLRTVINYIDWLNEFLKPLNLKVKIVEIKD